LGVLPPHCSICLFPVCGRRGVEFANAEITEDIIAFGKLFEKKAAFRFQSLNGSGRMEQLLLELARAPWPHEFATCRFGTIAKFFDCQVCETGKLLVNTGQLVRHDSEAVSGRRAGESGDGR
jgi:hypothetical protein